MLKESRHNATARSLVIGILCFVLCIFMLFGTTYAWFTSSLTTANNVIKTGSYNSSLSFSGAFSDTYVELSDTSELFGNLDLMPGDSSDVKYIKISNSNSYPITANISVGAVSSAGGSSELKLAFEIVTEEKTFTDADYSHLIASSVVILDNEEIAAGGSLVIALSVMLPLNAVNPGVTTSFPIIVSTTQAG